MAPRPAAAVPEALPVVKLLVPETERIDTLAVNEQGQPMENVNVALAEMRVGTSDWQQWSVQRFGALQQALDKQIAHATVECRYIGKRK